MPDFSPSDQKLLSDVSTIGWHIIHVNGDEIGPGWSYTIGLYHSFRHPEIVITGFNQQLTQGVLNNLGQDIKNGQIFVHGQDYEDILENVKCRMLEVKKEHYHEHFGYANWFYKSEEFPVLQCVFPTIQGVFPWDPDATQDFIDYQPLLTSSSS